ncbi:shikimate kinase [Chryseolinea sp. T2]|uniref:shikimate kinase n=1 Tax=Chryseolinea sp. T2 TaxID=3129255 RepID=UPI0030775C1D
MKVFLIGLPGSGKSTIGAALAGRLAMEFVDLDKEIEAKEGMIIPEIFSSKGEDYFRRVESEMLRQWAILDRNFIMSTGGGTPCFYDGISVINNNGVSVFLDEQIEVIVARLENNQHRPLLQSANVEDMRSKLQRLRDARLPFYQQASIIVSSPTVGKVLEKLRIKN